jgi:nitrate reductase delta subunit
MAMPRRSDRIVVPPKARLAAVTNSDRAHRTTAAIARARPAMRAFAKPDPAHERALARVRGWVRRRFKLPEETTILVAEVACAVPGCPPLETVVAFWSDERRHHFKVFKPVLQVVEDDLPPGWLKPALAVPDDFECDCC